MQNVPIWEKMNPKRFLKSELPIEVRYWHAKLQFHSTQTRTVRPSRPIPAHTNGQYFHRMDPAGTSTHCLAPCDGHSHLGEQQGQPHWDPATSLQASALAKDPIHESWEVTQECVPSIVCISEGGEGVVCSKDPHISCGGRAGMWWGFQGSVSPHSRGAIVLTLCGCPPLQC